MNIGPIKGNENNEIWKSYKNINRDFSKEKNLFFKNLKKITLKILINSQRF